MVSYYSLLELCWPTLYSLNLPCLLLPPGLCICYSLHLERCSSGFHSACFLPSFGPLLTHCLIKQVFHEYYTVTSSYVLSFFCMTLLFHSTYYFLTHICLFTLCLSLKVKLHKVVKAVHCLSHNWHESTYRTKGELSKYSLDKETDEDRP